MWFVFALVATLGWGVADLFYKKGADEDDRYSHLQTAIWVGIVMGLCSFIFLITTYEYDNFGKIAADAVKYLPASLSYIISMVIGYAGLRYLELSVISPVQNGSGAFSTVAMVVYFLIVGKISSIGEEYTMLDMIGTVLIVVGVIVLAIVEKRISDSESGLPREQRKYRLGALALIFPILYCIFDTIGTAADGIILDGETGLDLSEIQVLIIYGFTFLLAGIVSYIILWVKRGRPYNPFAASERPKMVASVFEECGQIFYVYAMAAKPLIAAPMIASYCVFSMLFSRVFLKEKLKTSQYLCLFAVIAGILILGIAEGISEAAI